MKKLPDRLKWALHFFGHVESHDPADLGRDIKGGRITDPEALKKEFSELLAATSLPLEEINHETGEEFETEHEAREWLKDFYETAFG